MKTKKNNQKTKEFLEKLPDIYMIGRWAGFGVRKYKFAGKHTEWGIPYVWDYYDGNGTCDEWHCIPLDHTTTGAVYAWTISRRAAEQIAEALHNDEGNT